MNRTSLAAVVALSLPAGAWAALTTSGPVTISGKDTVLIQGLKITSTSGNCVTISNSKNVVIKDSEIGPCGTSSSTGNHNGISIEGSQNVQVFDSYIHTQFKNMTGDQDLGDGVLIKNTSSVTIQGNVIAYCETNIQGLTGVSKLKIVGNFLLNPLGSYPRGQNIQIWGNSTAPNTELLVQNNYALSSSDTSKYLFAENQEDSINFGNSDGIVAKGNYVRGGRSDSGCGLITDYGAHNAQFLDNTVVDTAQCGIGIATGKNAVVSGNRVLLRTPIAGAGNSPIYVWNQYASACGPTQVTNNVGVTVFSPGSYNGYWNGGGCEPVTNTGNTWGSSAAAILEPIDAKYPAPKIPPQPNSCAALSPYSNQTAWPSCGSSSPPPPPPPPVAPSITQQPVSRTVNPGQSATFTVAASGTAPLTYQWQSLAGTAWTNVGGNSSSYATGAAGTYRCLVSNTAGSAASSAATLTIASISVSTGPVSYWRLDETSGLVATDSSGRGNTGALSGGFSRAAGVSGNAASFDGSTGVMNAGLQFANPQTFTVALWFKTTTTSGGKLIGFGNLPTGSSSQYDRHVYMANSGQLYFGVYPGSVKTINSAAALNDGRWHHVAASLSAGGMKLYVDGMLAASNSAVTSAQNYSGYWRLGYDNKEGWTNAPARSHFAGSIDEAAVFDRALSASEIQQLASLIPPSGPAITSLTLVGGNTAPDLQPLTDGGVIDLALTGTTLNVRANPAVSPVGSVVFIYDGARRVENAAPYSLAGDGIGYVPWTPALGPHWLKVTAYSGGNASGTAGPTLTINFTATSSKPLAAPESALVTVRTLSRSGAVVEAQPKALMLDARTADQALLFSDEVSEAAFLSAQGRELLRVSNPGGNLLVSVKDLRLPSGYSILQVRSRRGGRSKTISVITAR